MISIISRIPKVFKATSSQASLGRARLFLPKTSKSFNSTTSFHAEGVAMNHETLVKEFLSFRSSINRRVEALEKGTHVEIGKTTGELLLHSIGVEPEPYVEESSSTSEKHLHREIANSVSFPAEVEAMDHKALVKGFLESETSSKKGREDVLEVLKKDREDFLAFRASTNRRFEALEKGVALQIRDTAGELLLHCIGVEPQLHLEESTYFEQHKRTVFCHDIAEKVSIARTFLPSNLELADFGRVTNNRSGVYSMTAETLQLRVKECMDMFQKYPELVKSCSTEHAILSQDEVLHKGGIV